MKAAVVTEFNKPLEIQEVPVPKPKANQILVKMISTGVCHTDLHAACGDWPEKPKMPVIPGHEGVGWVVELGSNVDYLQLGDRVGMPYLATACLECDHCITGWETLCLAQESSGYSLDGTFAEYCVFDARFVAKIPESCNSHDVAPIICAGVTVYKGLLMCDCRAGDWVAISGIGGLGHVAVQYAVAMGYRVVAIDIDDKKLELAKKMGAEATVNAATQDPKEVVQSATGDGVQGVLVTAVSAKAFGSCIDILRNGGTMVCNGLPSGTFDLDIFNLVVRGITVRGSVVGSRKDLRDALKFAGAGKVKAHVSVEKLEDINSIFDRMKKGEIEGRVVIGFE